MPCGSGLAAFPPPLSPVSHLRADGFTGPLCCLLWLPRARWPCLRLLRWLVLFVFVFLSPAWCVSLLTALRSGVKDLGLSSLLELSSSHPPGGIRVLASCTYMYHAWNFHVRRSNVQALPLLLNLSMLGPALGAASLAVHNMRAHQLHFYFPLCFL